MEIKNLYQPFEIEFLETASYTAKEHKNTFFELVFILDGKGIQSINNNKLPYIADKLFLIFPQDSHGFEIEEPTKFLFIRFNESYLKTQSKEWVQKLKFIFHNHNHLPGCILKNKTDKPLVKVLIESLIREQNNQHPHQYEVIRQLINTLITIAARNITLANSHGFKSEQEHYHPHLLSYIHENICHPEQLKAEKIAANFNVSPTYISEYFKNKAGENLQQYISNYKMKLIETRLRFSNIQINEIVLEFGFTDASHLHRQFRKYKGISPTAYRKSFIKL